MAKTIKTRLEALEAASPDNKHEWTTAIFCNDCDQVQTKHYKDGIEVSLSQYLREFKPTPGDPITVKIKR